MPKITDAFLDDLMKLASSDPERENDAATESPSRARSRDAHTALSPAGEEGNMEHRRALDGYLASTGDVTRYHRDLFAGLFAHGKSGDYVTRSRSLTEKTAGLLPPRG